MATLHSFTGEEIIATELPSLLNQNFEYVNDNRIKTVNNVGYDENNNIDVTHLVTQSIQSGTDLNNLTTSGEYIRLGSVTKLLNSPSESPFFLTVLSSNNLVKQVLTELIANNPATFTRTMNSANWSPWIESGANIGTWESNEQVKVGDVRYVGGRDYTGYVLECVQAGTTGDSQPTISKGDIDNSTDLEGFSGTLQIAHGGHGADTVAGARANLGLSYATQSQAEVGTDNATVMTPLRTKQNYLPLKGGSMTGFQINRNTDASTLQLLGGTSISKSPYLTLFGSEEASTGAGKWQLVAVSPTDGTKKYLIGDHNGELTWVGKKVATNGALSMPSSSYITIQPSVEHGSANISEWYYTAPADGWLSWNFTPKISTRTGIINSASQLGLTIYTTANKGNRLMIPIKKGQRGWFYFESGDETNFIVDSKYFIYAQSEV